MLLSTGYDIIYTITNREFTWFFNRFNVILSMCNWSWLLLLWRISGDKSLAFVAFSIYSNGMKLFAYKKAKSPGMMHCLHGIRVISTQWVVLTHTYFIHMMLPMRNKSFLLTVCLSIKICSSNFMCWLKHIAIYSLRRNTTTCPYCRQRFPSIRFF